MQPLLAAVQPLLAAVQPLLPAVQPLLAAVQPLMAAVQPLMAAVPLPFFVPLVVVVAIAAFFTTYLCPWSSDSEENGRREERENFALNLCSKLQVFCRVQLTNEGNFRDIMQLIFKCECDSDFSVQI